MMERRGMNLAENLSKLYVLREVLKQEIADTAPKS